MEEKGSKKGRGFGDAARSKAWRRENCNAAKSSQGNRLGNERCSGLQHSWLPPVPESRCRLPFLVLMRQGRLNRWVPHCNLLSMEINPAKPSAPPEGGSPALGNLRIRESNEWYLQTQKWRTGVPRKSHGVAALNETDLIRRAGAERL